MKVIPERFWASPDEGYSRKILSVPDEGYSRKILSVTW
jgi:hypothetical protein